METLIATLESTLHRLAHEVADSFYRMHVGFQDPIGHCRRLIGDNVLEMCVSELKAQNPALEVAQFIIYLLDNVPSLPPPIDTDYAPFKSAAPFAPHLVCFALAYIKKHPERRFIRGFTMLVVRTGWWSGDENCIDDVIDALADGAEICKVAADSLSQNVSPVSVFAAGQLLYHLRYGENWGLRGYVKEQYNQALDVLKNAEDLAEIRERLKSGLKPWMNI